SWFPPPNLELRRASGRALGGFALARIHVRETAERTTRRMPWNRRDGAITVSSLEALQHLLGDELVAGVVEVVAVLGEDAAPLVVGVVRLPVGDEGLA